MADARPRPARNHGSTPCAAPDSLADLTALAVRVLDLYATRTGIVQDDLWSLAKLAEETGELTAAWLSAHGRGRARGLDAAALRRAVEDEAADLLGFVLHFAHRNDIDLGAALVRKWGAHLPDA